MAILHRATISPTKAEAVTRWLDQQSWGGSGEVHVIGGYRFDDPDGEVGVEALLVRRGDRVLQVPMTYRGAPLNGADAHLITEMSHTALGPRWVYVATADPVALSCYRRALAGDQHQASLEVHDGDQVISTPDPVVRVRRETGGAGPAGDLRLAQVLGEDMGGVDRLIASWPDGEAVVASC